MTETKKAGLSKRGRAIVVAIALVGSAFVARCVAQEKTPAPAPVETATAAPATGDRPKEDQVPGADKSKRKGLEAKKLRESWTRQNAKSSRYRAIE